MSGSVEQVSDTIKIGVNIPVTSPALDACININKLVNNVAPSVVVLGSGGTSSPHVTIAMGLMQSGRFDELVDVVTRFAFMLKSPISLKFSEPYRETVTGRYVMSSVALSDDVKEWRLMARDGLSGMFVEPARTSDDAHLTLGLAESNVDAVDRILASAPEIPPCFVDCLHVSTSGSKGIKTSILAEVQIAGS